MMGEGEEGVTESIVYMFWAMTLYCFLSCPFPF